MNNESTRPFKKRRIYFIEKEFQTKFILKFLTLVVIGGFITIGALFLFTARSSTVAFVNSRAVVKTTAQFLLPLLIQTMIVVTIAVSLAAIALAMFASHKISGPLYRFKKVLDSLTEGDFSGDFRLRRYDQLQDLAGAFNDMIANTRSRIKLLKDNSSLLHETLGGVLASDLNETNRQKINELEKLLSELDKALRHFRV